LFIVCCVCAFICFLLAPLESRLHADWDMDDPLPAVGLVTESNREGAVLALLGGFRTLFANLLWLEIYQAWEQRDRLRLERLIPSVTHLSPENEYFWVHAAGMLAYDVPHWRIEAAGGSLTVNADVQNKMHRVQAEEALSLLERGLQWQPASLKLYLEAAHICVNKLSDYERAASWFYQASQLSDAPDYVRRQYADQLIHLGRLDEAVNFLEQLAERLALNDPQQQLGLVQRRLDVLREQVRP
jgi:tetratricopeptide (TPR) repeat protein